MKNDAKYISITAHDESRVSTLSIEDAETLMVVGNMTHGYKFTFNTIDDAKKLKEWLDFYITDLSKAIAEE